MNSNLESFACLWLDRNVNSTEDNIKTQKELRRMINHLRIFDNIDKCEEYIRQITQEKVILIVSGSLGRDFVPRLHDLPQLTACYVFCQDQKTNEQWANKYHKVNGVFINYDKLIAKISEDQIGRKNLVDGTSISVISSGSQSLEVRNAMFMWFQLFIEVLLRMHHKSNDRKEFLDICKNNYNDNEEEMEMINEFEKSYKPENAIRWYTRESCFYRIMNKALRVQDFDLLFSLRFFITDIAKQIKIENEKFIRTTDSRNIFRVYRGQLIGNNELELMKNNIGQFLSMNSFLSTTRSRSTALQFVLLNQKTDDVQKLIFEIEINPRLKTKAFADITQMSFFQKEDEILIMLGALFRIEQIYENDKEGIWIARVSLASEDDYQLKEIFSYMKNRIDDDTDLGSLGKILLEMGEYEQARKCYKRMLDEGQLVCGNASLGLGKICMQCKEADESVKHLEEALRIRQSLLGQDHADVGECYTFIGGLYCFLRSDYDQALSNLKKAVQIQEVVPVPDYLSLATTYHHIAVAYRHTKEYDLSQDYFSKALNIRQKLLPHDHPDIASIYNNLGVLHEYKGSYSEALKYYENAVEIWRKILPPSHLHVKVAEENIRSIKNKIKT
ncbi:unnamed protein product [Rotaria sp. Silwood1]|nr:unnamed protein product [Rotaria sp. Silwood1]